MTTSARVCVDQRADLLDLARADEGGGVDAPQRLRRRRAHRRPARPCRRGGRARPATPRPGCERRGSSAPTRTARSGAAAVVVRCVRSPERQHPGAEHALDSIDDLRRSPQPGGCSGSARIVSVCVRPQQVQEGVARARDARRGRRAGAARSSRPTCVERHAHVDLADRLGARRGERRDLVGDDLAALLARSRARRSTTTGVAAVDDVLVRR